MRNCFSIAFLFFLGLTPLKADENESIALLCNWHPVVTLPDRMKVFGLIFNDGRLEMLGLDADGEVRGSGLGVYIEDDAYWYWEGAPLFGRNALNRKTLSSAKGEVRCERSQSSNSLRSSLKVLSEKFRNKG